MNRGKQVADGLAGADDEGVEKDEGAADEEKGAQPLEPGRIFAQQEDAQDGDDERAAVEQ